LSPRHETPVLHNMLPELELAAAAVLLVAQAAVRADGAHERRGLREPVSAGVA
jgi:hypothetical protein